MSKDEAQDYRGFRNPLALPILVEGDSPPSDESTNIVVDTQTGQIDSEESILVQFQKLYDQMAAKIGDLTHQIGNDESDRVHHDQLPLFGDYSSLASFID